jgi:hypothetical protein
MNKQTMRGTNMNRSVVKSMSWFVAGVACASVIAGVLPEYMSGEEWDERMNAWLVEGEVLGAHVVEVHRGRVYVNPEPIACPKPPQPKLPTGAVDPWLLGQAMEAGAARNQLLMLNANVAARETARCQTIPPELTKW